MKRRTKEHCFKLNVIPDWYKALKDKKQGVDNNKSVVNMLDSPMDAMEDNVSQFGDLQASIVAMVQQGIAQYMKGNSIGVETSEIPAHLNLAHLHDFAGSLLNSNHYTYAFTSHGSWIVDTGASNHMCVDKSLLVNSIIPSKQSPVYLPDGSTMSAESIGH
ncbi:hypothetical protein Sjap_017794 [Stephania japonica]|uniref:Retrovirus-related Pol polyprotein from transposon TNT 1-94-like beta-barrel domain-containing protein n=1 Tax=Stephania japonica TaxID=461633 RepID=A0AAP0NKD9_9MAGN